MFSVLKPKIDLFLDFFETNSMGNSSNEKSGTSVSLLTGKNQSEDNLVFQDF